MKRKQEEICRNDGRAEGRMRTQQQKKRNLTVKRHEKEMCNRITVSVKGERKTCGVKRNEKPGELKKKNVRSTFGKDLKGYRIFLMDISTPTHTI